MLLLIWIWHEIGFKAFRDNTLKLINSQLDVWSFTFAFLFLLLYFLKHLLITLVFIFLLWILCFDICNTISWDFNFPVNDLYLGSWLFFCLRCKLSIRRKLLYEFIFETNCLLHRFNYLCHIVLRLILVKNLIEVQFCHAAEFVCL